MRIHEAAAAAGISAKTARRYEAAGLVRPARLPNGERDYSEADVQALRDAKGSTAKGKAAKNSNHRSEELALEAILSRFTRTPKGATSLSTMRALAGEGTTRETLQIIAMMAPEILSDRWRTLTVFYRLRYKTCNPVELGPKRAVTPDTVTRAMRAMGLHRKPARQATKRQGRQGLTMVRR